MCRSPFKYNLTFIVLFFGITLIHAGDEGEETSKDNIELYYTKWSPPCRSVMMIGKMLDIPFKLIEFDLEKHEHITAEYEKVNPLLKVPAINDKGFFLFESRAIIVYLVQKYGEGDQSNLYSEDLQIQANINKMLEFDLTTLGDAFINLYSPWIFYKTPKTEYKINNLKTALAFFENLLVDDYAVGKSLTVADVALASNIVTIQAIGEDISHYKKITEWLARCEKNIKEFMEVNAAGIEFAKIKADHRRNEDINDLFDGSVSNSDILQAISTLTRGVQTQVISTKYLKHFESLKTRLLLLG